ncbi:MAG TPA: hypothetical protein VK190_03215 [Pseudoneobacillus sp.]|jgi:hypothetical protein|nr:hypothetical protein [Pseudoneobacillus sp.]
MDIKQEFHEFITKYGHPALIVKHNSKVKCSCHTIEYGPDKNCPLCLGNGYLFKAEKIMTRDRLATVNSTLPNSIKDTVLGNLAVPTKMFYLEDTVRPDMQDYIVDCAWDKFGKPVFDEYSGVYEINQTEPYRGQSGEIEYFKAACRYDPVNITNFKAYLTRKANIITYHVAIGGI